MAGKSLMSRARAAWHVRRKNRRLNRNVHDFLRSYAGGALPPRESIIAPEVVIPCFNHGRFLESALESIPAGCPVTIVDDASTDDTPEVVARLESRFAFRLLRNERNLLQPGSLNRAVASSANTLFVVLNADDCLLPYAVATLLELFDAYPSIRLAGGGCIPFSDDSTRRLAGALPSRLPYVPRGRIYNADDARRYTRLNDIHMTMSGSAFLRSAWEAVDGFWDFAPRVCSYDDRDFQMRVSCLFDVCVIDEPLTLYRTTSSLGRAQFTA